MQFCDGTNCFYAKTWKHALYENKIVNICHVSTGSGKITLNIGRLVIDSCMGRLSESKENSTLHGPQLNLLEKMISSHFEWNTSGEDAVLECLT